MSRINRRTFIRNTTLASASLAAAQCTDSTPPSGEPARPNLLFVFTDQHRKQALGFRGEDPVITPNLDSFAGEGMVFDNACSNYPLCTPFRGMLLTGKYPHSSGLTANCNSAHTKYGIYLKESERCISDVLFEAGYNTGFIGKWHLDAPDAPDAEHWSEGVWDAYTPPGPRRHSFEFWYSYGVMFDLMKPYFWVGDAGKDEKTVVDQWEVAHEADVAIEYIRNRDGSRRDSNKPFALFVAPHPPHTPFDQVPEKYLVPYEGLPLDELLNRANVDLSRDSRNTSTAKQWVRHYFAAVTGIDEHFGRLMQCLAEEGLERDTIVVFTADHGEMMGSHDLMSKSVWFEESFGIPLMIRWKDHISPAREKMPIGVPDLFPTLLALMGLQDRVPMGVEGADYSDLLLGRSSSRVESAFYLRPTLHPGPRDGWRGVRTVEHFFGVSRPEGGEEYTLFDLVRDPYQLKNVADANPSLVKELRTELDRWLDHTRDPWLEA